MSVSTNCTSVRIGLIGLGPRGLIVLERIAWLARLRPSLAVSLDIFEPGTPGTGCHAVDQPEYLKLNTIACQLSMFPDDPSLPFEEQRLGPSLYQWCKLQGIQVMDEHQMADSIRRSRPVRSNDFLPRKILGQYLVWFHRMVMADIPPNLYVKLHRTTAVSIDKRPVLELRILGADGVSAVVDRAFITIGHARSNAGSSGRSARTISSPYPLPGALTRLAPASTIVIRGLGLSAMDIMMAAITEWGGRFESQAGTLRYFPSGREGKLIFSSRAGLPYLARPVTTEDHKRVEARFLTSEIIQQLKRAAGPGKLDFEHSVLPLMRLEMQAAYYGCLAAQEGQFTAESVARELARAATIGRASDVMRALAKRWGPYEPDRYLQLRAPRPSPGSAHRDWLIHQLREDIQESRAGLAVSPSKAAIEVWRDLRDNVREIIDGGSLSSESRLAFFKDYAPMINRLVAGPQWERSAELLCLIEAEIADVVLASESGDIHLDGNEIPIHVDAYVGSSGAARTDTPLLCNLVEKGIATDLRSTVGIDGIAVTAEGDIISPEGFSASKLWLFGPAAEGATYYNHYIPSPGRLSRAQRDAQTAVKECLLGDPTSKFVSVYIDTVSDAAE